MLSGRHLSQQSKLRSTVAFWSTEAEYMVTTEAGKEELWVAKFLACLGFCRPSQPVNLRTDNKWAISLTKNPRFPSENRNPNPSSSFLYVLAIGQVFLRAQGGIASLQPTTCDRAS